MATTAGARSSIRLREIQTVELCSSGRERTRLGHAGRVTYSTVIRRLVNRRGQSQPGESRLLLTVTELASTSLEWRRIRLQRADTNDVYATGDVAAKIYGAWPGLDCCSVVRNVFTRERRTIAESRCSSSSWRSHARLRTIANALRSQVQPDSSSGSGSNVAFTSLPVGELSPKSSARVKLCCGSIRVERWRRTGQTLAKSWRVAGSFPESLILRS